VGKRVQKNASSGLPAAVNFLEIMARRKRDEAQLQRIRGEGLSGGEKKTTRKAEKGHQRARDLGCRRL